jgi:Secretion system C-terminal sorting domain
MNKFFLIILLFVCQFHLAKAQNVSFDWADAMGGTGFDLARGSCTDYQNIYVTGWFEDTVDFDPGVGVTNLISNGGQDFFVQKLDANGNLLWVKSFGGTGNDRGYSVSYSGGNSFYVTGYFENTVDFDPDTGITNLTSNGGTDIFILVLNLSGDLISAKSIGGPLNDGGLSCSVDNWQSLSVTGFFSNTVDFDPNAGVHNLTSLGGLDGFVIKVNSFGSLDWVVPFGGFGNDWGTSVVSDDWYLDYVYVTGVFEGFVDIIDNQSNFYSFFSYGGQDILTMKLVYGSIVWATSFGGSGNDIANSVVFGASSLSITGSYEGTVDFDPLGGVSNLSSNGGKDVFVQKIDESNGNLLWAKSFGGTLNDQGLSVSTSGSYLTGSFMGTVDFDPGLGVTNLTSNGNEDVFVQKLDFNGNLIWAKSFGGIGSDIGYSIHPFSSRGLCIAGSYENTTDFDPDLGVYNLTSNGLSDAFVLGLRECYTVYDAITKTVCTDYTGPSGNYTWMSSGTFQDTVIGTVMNCDTFYTVYLTVDTINTLITNLAPTLIANDSVATYQWIDCTTMLPMIGDTNQSFSALVSGSYAVVLTKNGCMDTSACQFINAVEVSENNFPFQIKILPNPATNLISIVTELKLKQIKILSISGKVIKVIQENSKEINVSDLAKGIYFIQLTREGNTIIEKFIKN